MPFDHFDVIAGIYDRAAQFFPSDILLEALDLHPSLRLLDAGGGTGRVSASLRDRVREVVVADVSRGMLQQAAGKGLPSLCAPAEALPFAAGTFDRVFMLDALHHVHNQRDSIAELWRVVAPGGRVIIVEPDIHRFAVKLIAVGEKALLMRSHFLSGEKIAALFPQHQAKVRVIQNEFNVIIFAEK
jgi:ubiquinone/menaquinone biosynthesis C-methylase UbiE